MAQQTFTWVSYYKVYFMNIIADETIPDVTDVTDYSMPTAAFLTDTKLRKILAYNPNAKSCIFCYEYSSTFTGTY